jgi:hypothetical protein
VVAVLSWFIAIPPVLFVSPALVLVPRCGKRPGAAALRGRIGALPPPRPSRAVPELAIPVP